MSHHRLNGRVRMAKENSVVAEPTVIPKADLAKMVEASRAVERAKRALNRAQVDFEDVVGEIGERYNVLQGQSINIVTGVVT